MTRWSTCRSALVTFAARVPEVHRGGHRLGLGLGRGRGLEHGLRRGHAGLDGVPRGLGLGRGCGLGRGRGLGIRLAVGSGATAAAVRVTVGVMYGVDPLPLAGAPLKISGPDRGAVN